jgi:hypothetical protein
MVSVKNKKWHTVNLIVRPQRLLASKIATLLHENELLNFVTELQVDSYDSIAVDEVRNLYVGLVRDAGFVGDNHYYHRTFELRTAGEAEASATSHKDHPPVMDHTKARLPGRRSLTPHITSATA